jgi:hypothetical protein
MMQEHKKVVVCGHFPFSKDIEAGLRREHGFLVVQIDDTQPDAAEHIAVLQPDILIVDVTTTPWERAVTHLRQDKGMAMIGINPHDNTMMVLRGQRFTLAWMHEVTALVERTMNRNNPY